MSPSRILESWWQERPSEHRCARPGCDRPVDPWFGEVCAACGLDEMLQEPDERFDDVEPLPKPRPRVH